LSCVNQNVAFCHVCKCWLMNRIWYNMYTNWYIYNPVSAPIIAGLASMVHKFSRWNRKLYTYVMLIICEISIYTKWCIIIFIITHLFLFNYIYLGLLSIIGCNTSVFYLTACLSTGQYLHYNIYISDCIFCGNFVNG
jgi:hypothetical protein